MAILDSYIIWCDEEAYMGWILNVHMGSYIIWCDEEMIQKLAGRKKSSESSGLALFYFYL